MNVQHRDQLSAEDPRLSPLRAMLVDEAFLEAARSRSEPLSSGVGPDAFQKPKVPGMMSSVDPPDGTMPSAAPMFESTRPNPPSVVLPPEPEPMQQRESAAVGSQPPDVGASVVDDVEAAAVPEELESSGPPSGSEGSNQLDLLLGEVASDGAKQNEVGPVPGALGNAAVDEEEAGSEAAVEAAVVEVGSDFVEDYFATPMSDAADFDESAEAPVVALASAEAAAVSAARLLERHIRRDREADHNAPSELLPLKSLAKAKSSRFVRKETAPPTPAVVEKQYASTKNVPKYEILDEAHSALEDVAAVTVRDAASLATSQEFFLSELEALLRHLNLPLSSNFTYYDAQVWFHRRYSRYPPILDSLRAMFRTCNSISRWSSYYHLKREYLATLEGEDRTKSPSRSSSRKRSRRSVQEEEVEEKVSEMDEKQAEDDEDGPMEEAEGIEKDVDEGTALRGDMLIQGRPRNNVLEAPSVYCGLTMVPLVVKNLSTSTAPRTMSSVARSVGGSALGMGVDIMTAHIRVLNLVARARNIAEVARSLQYSAVASDLIEVRRQLQNEISMHGTEMYPDAADGLELLAMVALRAKDLEEFRTCSQELVKLYRMSKNAAPRPAAAEILSLRLLLSLGKGDVGDLQQLNRALNDYPDDLNVQLARRVRFLAANEDFGGFFSLMSQLRAIAPTHCIALDPLERHMRQAGVRSLKRSLMNGVVSLQWLTKTLGLWSLSADERAQWFLENHALVTFDTVMLQTPQMR